MKILSAHAPTGAYGNDAVEKFYDALESSIGSFSKGTYIVCAGDYDAHLGQGEAGEYFVGPMKSQEGVVEVKH